MDPNTRLPDGFGRDWVTALISTLTEAAPALGDLDRRSGDGDFGTNLASAMKKVRAEVEQRSPETFGEWLTCVSRGFLGTGGTSGPLFGMFYRAIGRCTTETEPTVAELIDGFADGQRTIQHYGEAEVGDKTMVDALAPAVEAGRAASTEPLRAAADAAREGALGTAEVLARRGRASYVGEASRGVPDPGAIACALVVETAAAAASGDRVDLGWVTELAEE